MNHGASMMKQPLMKIDVITTFPDMFSGFLGESMLARGQEQGLVTIDVHDLRNFTDDIHRTVDDTPFGGGGGMILKAEPIVRAVETLQTAANGYGPASVIIPTARGERFTQSVAHTLATHARLIFVCGHYTGIDERVFDYLKPRRMCIGDYILTGGELPSMVMIDAIARRLPGFLGNDDSAKDDSFMADRLGAPHYTRPQEWRGLSVPEVLVSGHHANVEQWRGEMADKTTVKFRPELSADSKQVIDRTGQ